MLDSRMNGRFVRGFLDLALDFTSTTIELCR